MMSEPGHIDFITQTPETGVVNLYMVEHRPWDDTEVMSHDFIAKLPRPPAPPPAPLRVRLSGSGW